jgi:hypothetical protein
MQMNFLLPDTELVLSSFIEQMFVEHLQSGS